MASRYDIALNKGPAKKITISFEVATLEEFKKALEIASTGVNESMWASWKDLDWSVYVPPVKISSTPMATKAEYWGDTEEDVKKEKPSKRTYPDTQ